MIDDKRLAYTYLAGREKENKAPGGPRKYYKNGQTSKVNHHSIHRHVSSNRFPMKMLHIRQTKHRRGKQNY